MTAISGWNATGFATACTAADGAARSPASCSSAAMPPLFCPTHPLLDAVVLLKQFRIGAYAAGWNPWLIEIVAGIIEPGEKAEDVVRREAAEEAGLAVSEILPIAEYLPSPGGTSETTALFCGRVDAARAGGTHGLAEEGEDIEVSIHQGKDIEALVSSGRIRNAVSLIALQWFVLNRQALRRRWG